MREKESAVQDVQFAIEGLLRLARRRGFIVCGFAFSLDPLSVINFGNCKDAHELRLYEKLVTLCENQRSKGAVTKVTVEEVN